MLDRNSYYIKAGAVGRRCFTVLTVFFLLWCMMAGCRKKKDENIPLVNVNISIYVSDPQYLRLSVVGGYEYLTGGSRGILVYRSDIDHFKAYERHCPYQPDNSCGRVEVDTTNLYLTDPCCGSKFAIGDGALLTGPAATALKQYNTSFDGSILRIYN